MFKSYNRHHHPHFTNKEIKVQSRLKVIQLIKAQTQGECRSPDAKFQNRTNSVFEE